LATGVPARPLARHCGTYLWSLAAGTLPGRSVVLTAGSLGDPSGPGAVQAWDPQLGMTIGEPMVHERLVRAVTITTIDGLPVAVTRTDHGCLSIWDLTSHRLIRQRPYVLISTFSNLVVAEVGGRPTLVFGTAGGLRPDSRTGR
jgi:hypothetical protein